MFSMCRFLVALPLLVLLSACNQGSNAAGVEDSIVPEIAAANSSETSE